MTGFFDELGRERSAAIEAVSMDMGLAFAKSVRVGGHALRAVICFDPFHVVNAVTDALEIVHRELWGQLRNLPDPLIAKKFKGARWTLLKNPGDLSDSQAATLAGIRRHGGAMWRAYLLKKPFGRSSTVTSTSKRRWRSWTAGAQAHIGSGPHRSSKPLPRSATIATGSAPRWNEACPTD